ncbi:MAG TPA: DUF5606 domain-containing protein [Chitinophagaceae bacterium]|jgi:hypothetical protein|nr:DUF5606 domain-containing protein [Chitinophagaceae bacterium]
MEYKEIVAVTGEPGLFQLLSSKSDGAIVRSLNGETTKFVPSRNHNFTPLESIEVFTTAENVSLTEVFKAMVAQEQTHPVIDAGTGSEDIKNYFREVFPTLDEERVYMSDMKKMLKWYPQLKSNDLLTFEEKEEEKEEAVEGASPEAASTKGAPAEKGNEVKEEKKSKASAKAATAAPEKKETPKKETSKKETATKDASKKKPAAKKKSSAKKEG